MKKRLINSYPKNIVLFLTVIFAINIASITAFAQNNPAGVNLDTVKAQKFDNGKMWTFEFPPLDYFQETYNFRPAQEWMDNVRLSALRFADYCSASFVSEDGLVMTNHHCGRESVTLVQKSGEDFHKDGFIAVTLEDERKIPGLYVDQLVKIENVTKEIQAESDKGKTAEERNELRDKKIAEIEKKLKEQTGFVCQVVSLYNGGVYSAYLYKRFNDVRLVFAPEDQAGFFGGDPDNFTYPRYNLDCTFFRVYDENGQPLKAKHYYRWSKSGANPGEPLFVVGNPGSTSRLLTVSQLEYNRDIDYPYILKYINKVVDSLKREISNNPAKEKDLNDNLFSFTNSQKVYVGIIKGLNDMVLMARKKDFEKKFRSAVDAKPELKKKYGDTWSKIDELVQEKRKIAAQRNSTNGYEIYMKIQELSGQEDYYKQVLGRALYDVYGTSIPPDATFTLRISDGVIKSYEYNGTIAPPKTTFYGMYDRYYSFAKQYPWSLNERWINPPAEFNLETPFNFISTNDIIGGNSGSPIINKDAEIVGLVFDGNIESMSDEFIYSSDAPHTVSVDSQGLYEVIKDMYKVTRLAQEIENGKIVK
jgi:hypothetical protein